MSRRALGVNEYLAVIEAERAARPAEALLADEIKRLVGVLGDQIDKNKKLLNRLHGSERSRAEWRRKAEGTRGWVRAMSELVESLIDEGECRFDHHGGCQKHGFLSLEQGEKCPQAELKELLGWTAGDAR